MVLVADMRAKNAFRTFGFLFLMISLELYYALILKVMVGLKKGEFSQFH